MPEPVKSPTGLTVAELIEAPEETLYAAITRRIVADYKKAHDEALDFAIVNGYDPTGMIG
jgi:hypothetical protein